MYSIYYKKGLGKAKPPFDILRFAWAINAVNLILMETDLRCPRQVFGIHPYLDQETLGGAPANVS